MDESLTIDKHELLAMLKQLAPDDFRLVDAEAFIQRYDVYKQDNCMQFAEFVRALQGDRELH